MTEDTTKPNIEERYSSATNTSTMKMEVERAMPIDVLTAAGWSQSRIGAALLRLHSEFDAAEKPRRPTAEAITRLAATMLMKDGTKKVKRKQRSENGQVEIVEAVVDNMVPDVKAARSEAARWYFHEQKLLMGKLKTLPALRGQVELHLKDAGHADPASQAAAVLCWWLDQTCPCCHGLKFQRIEGAPALSHKPCPRPQHGGCGGTGKVAVPYGEDGKRLANWLDGCVQIARSRIGHSLHQRRK